MGKITHPLFRRNAISLIAIAIATVASLTLKVELNKSQPVNSNARSTTLKIEVDVKFRNTLK
ncbi:MAG: hypothetical protein AAFQ91_23020 [Cyanobacteria bacterium J06621_15]